MNVSKLTLNSLKKIITGDDSTSDYMSGPDLVVFFNNFGIVDSYDFKNGGLPNALSRNDYTLASLETLNGNKNFKDMLEAIVDNRKTNNIDIVADEVNEIIKYDGYSLEKNETGIYRVIRLSSENLQNIEAYFKDIKEEIVECIKEAKFFIWVAVAWFTDKDIGNELRKKHLSGVNVRVIVNDDETTQKYGLDFKSKGIEYIKVSPDSDYGKKLMHNKFCIIDLIKVIHGSYNWTSNAKYNNESITITEGRDISEEFALEFIKLSR